MEEIILKVKNLEAEMAGVKVLNGLSFEVKKGEILVILGPNGAGKTVLLRTLLGLLPHKGEIDWGKGIKIGYVPQRIPFIKEIPLSVEEFFGLKKISLTEARNLLGEVGLSKEGFFKQKMGDLSSGQFQRVLVAWALASNSDVLLFDEPTSGIDAEGEKAIYSLLEKRQKEKGLTILLVSHDLSVVYRFANNVLCLNRKMLCFGPPKEMLTQEKISELYSAEVSFYQHDHK